MININEQNSTVDIVSHNTNLKGNLTFGSTVKIDGTIEGNITTSEDESKAILIIGQDAFVNAKIMCNFIVIEGLVKGDITAKGTVEIKKSGIVFGNVTAANVIIQPGGVLEGSCKILSH